MEPDRSMTGGPRTDEKMQHHLTARAGLSALALGAFLLVGAAAAPAANAADPEVPGVSASCTTLTVKPHGYASKGEVRVVVDGEVQTDGDDEGWREFKGSYPGVYTFEPTDAHTYSVQVNSYSADSAGRDFAPGSGGDASVEASTEPCGAVRVVAAATSCDYDWQASKQSIDLTITELRRSVTYLVEVLDDGDVVQHFQFRNAPEELKTFNHLDAGRDYVVRVTDQSNPVLSTSVQEQVPGCAARVSLAASAPVCAPEAGADVTLVLGDLVTGRGYAAAISDEAGASREVELVAGAPDARVVLHGVPGGHTYAPSVRDVQAPRLVRADPVDLPVCGASGEASDGGDTGTDVGGTTTVPGASVPEASVRGASVSGAVQVEDAASVVGRADSAAAPVVDGRASGTGGAAGAGAPASGASADDVEPAADVRGDADGPDDDGTKVLGSSAGDPLAGAGDAAGDGHGRIIALLGTLLVVAASAAWFVRHGLAVRRQR